MGPKNRYFWGRDENRLDFAHVVVARLVAVSPGFGRRDFGDDPQIRVQRLKMLILEKSSNFKKWVFVRHKLFQVFSIEENSGKKKHIIFDTKPRHISFLKKECKQGWAGIDF